MGDNKGLLTVAEFAERAGVSRSSVYKRMSTTLQPFIVEVDKVKMLKIEALSLYDIQPKVDKSVEDSTKENQPSTPPLSPLERELERQIRLNEELLEQIREKDAHIMRMSETLLEQGNRLMQLTEQSHILLRENQLRLDQQDGGSSPEPESEPEKEPEPEKEAAAAEPPQPEKEQPRGFFSRLFG